MDKKFRGLIKFAKFFKNISFYYPDIKNTTTFEKSYYSTI